MKGAIKAMSNIQILKDVITAEFITKISTMFFNPAMLLVLANIIIQAVILKTIEVPKYWLRFIPFYGDYYYMKTVSPKRKALAFFIANKYIWYEILTLISAFFFQKIDKYPETVGAMYPVYDEIFKISLVLGTAVLVIAILLEVLICIDITEAFLYEKELCIIFLTIPIVGSLLSLRNARQAFECGKFLYLKYPKRDVSYFK